MTFDVMGLITKISILISIKYLLIIFEKKRLYAEYIQRRCHARVNFMKSIVGQSWDAQAACLLGWIEIFEKCEFQIAWGLKSCVLVPRCHIPNIIELFWRLSPPLFS
jgi:hypothetical protein